VYEVLPGVRQEHAPALYRLGNKLGALRKYLTGAERIMPYLAVPHIVVGRQPDGRAVSLERKHRIAGHEPVQHRSARRAYGVARLACAKPYSVHDYRYYRPFFGSEDPVAHFSFPFV